MSYVLCVMQESVLRPLVCVPLNARNAHGIISSLLFIKCYTRTNDACDRCER